MIIALLPCNKIKYTEIRLFRPVRDLFKVCFPIFYLFIIRFANAGEINVTWQKLH